MFKRCIAVSVIAMLSGVPLFADNSGFLNPKSWTPGCVKGVECRISFDEKEKALLFCGGKEGFTGWIAPEFKPRWPERFGNIRTFGFKILVDFEKTAPNVAFSCLIFGGAGRVPFQLKSVSDEWQEVKVTVPEGKTVQHFFQILLQFSGKNDARFYFKDFFMEDDKGNPLFLTEK